MILRAFFVFAFVFACLYGVAPVSAQLRVVTYNTLQGPNPGFATVVEAIGEENRGGIAKPIDVLLLQEQTSPTGSTQTIVNQLNSIYGAGTYARGSLVGDPFFSDIRQGIVYNTQTVQLLGEVAIGSAGGGSLPPRQTLRYQLRPVGYDSSADFYAYNSHYKASDGASNEARRLTEAQIIRSSANALGQGASIIYAGDFNMRSSNEDAFEHLLSSGNGQAFDPIDQLGIWHKNSSFAEWHTQSPCIGTGCSPGFAGGGIDDRFDFQLVSGELLDNEGLSYIPGSYRTFGNNGSTFDDAINVGNSITFSGITSFTKTQILNALESAADHLPVVADYQIPAALSAIAGSVPTMLDQGQSFNLDLLISNVASVIVAAGADELDYSFTTTGDLSGSGSGIEFALAAGDTHFVSLDTSTQGAKSGSIIVTTSSQGASNSLITIPISFQVGEGGGGGGGDPMVIARALFPSVSDDLGVTGFQFGGEFTTEDTDTNSGGTLPVGSDARTLAFTSLGDMFGIEDRGDNSPFAVVDDSAGSFANDLTGIIKTSDTDNFFGAVDLENSNNVGPLTAEWTFDISSATGGLELSIDMAAMGVFESASDSFAFDISIDGSGFSNVFTTSIDEAASQTYTLEDGDMFTLDDPLLVNGTLLNNNFQTLTSQIAGTGSQLTLRFTAIADGSDEAFAFRNIVIEGLTTAAGLQGDFNDDGVVNAADYTVWRDNLGAGDELALNGNGDGLGGVDAADYALWKAAFGNSSASLAASNASVPEPGTLGLLFFAAVLPMFVRYHHRMGIPSRCA